MQLRGAQFHRAGRIDWILFFSILPILAAGLVTMHSFTGPDIFFTRQLIWIALSLTVFFTFSFVDFRFLRKTGVVVTLYGIGVALLAFLFLAGAAFQGAQSWFDFGFFTFQPADFATISLIILLAKYFSRRHIEIAHVRHILVSAAYTLILFVLVLLQPDFGSAIIIFLIWIGMVAVSGISKKHLLAVLFASILALSSLWVFAFEDYQKDRLLTFLHPLTDISGAGYNAYQSTVAVGSGELLGKGVAYGTQSRLQFLPEYETDFIFAAYAEEWGFIGVMVLFFFYALFFWRILQNAMRGATNFEILFGLGLFLMFMSHFLIHVGMNIGLLPITGTTIPLMSYGGSHLLAGFIGLGILMGQRSYARTAHKEDVQREMYLPV